MVVITYLRGRVNESLGNQRLRRALTWSCGRAALFLVKPIYFQMVIRHESSSLWLQYCLSLGHLVKLLAVITNQLPVIFFFFSVNFYEKLILVYDAKMSESFSYAIFSFTHS